MNVVSTPPAPASRALRAAVAMAAIGFPAAIGTALIAKGVLHLPLTTPLAMLICALASAASTSALRCCAGGRRRSP